MATATNSSAATGNAAITATAHAKFSDPESGDEPLRHPSFSEQLGRVCGHCLRGATLVLVGYSFAVTAWRVRHQPQNLGFVSIAASLLAALFMCLRRAERLAPDSPVEERRRVQAAVWALSTALSCAFAHRVAAVMPPPLAILIWCMTAFVGIAGFYLLVLCREQQQYQALPGDDDAASHKKASAKMSPTDELV